MNAPARAIALPEPEAAPHPSRRPRSLLEASDPGPVSVRRLVPDDGLLRELRARLKAAGILTPAPGYYPRKLVEVLGLWALGAALVFVLRDSRAVVLVGLLLGVTSAQTVLLGHDAAHGAAFIGQGRLARALGRMMPHVLIGLLSGGSAAWWRKSHNAHHALSNDPALDPDIEYPFLAFDPAQAATREAGFAFFLRRQHLLVWLVMPLAAVTIRLYSLAFLLRRIGKDRGARGRNLLALAALLTFWGGYLSLVFSALPPVRALGLIAVHQAVFGLYLALITSTNHWAMPMPDLAGKSYFEHQVMTSRNIRGGALVRFFYGGLDRQIEHHLFVRLPRPRLREASKHVEALCRERGVPYVERTPWEALRDIYTCMRGVARNVPPAEPHV
jgi:fatty acid desaturase